MYVGAIWKNQQAGAGTSMDGSFADSDSGGSVTGGTEGEDQGNDIVIV